MNLPWWAWVLLVVGVLFALLVVSTMRRRASLRREFLAYLAANHPEVEARASSSTELAVRLPDGSEGSLYLGNLFRQGAELGVGDQVARRSLFEHFAAAITEGGRVLELDPEADRARVFPRIVRDDFPEQAAAEGGHGPLPSLPLGPPGLRVVFVIDSEHSVAYLTEAQLAELGLSPEEALEVAKSNLGASFEPEVARQPLGDGSISVLKSMDTYDAARLLLVPECLEEGESLAALIPDRDTLALAAVPADGDWSSLASQARNAAGEPLWPQPLQVTPAGITAVEK